MFFHLYKVFIIGRIYALKIAKKHSKMAIFTPGIQIPGSASQVKLLKSIVFFDFPPPLLARYDTSLWDTY